ncbi:hypothetical protein BDV25DRAFT_136365 [Aspergillus avenaceus]|uniref:Uncharacterized protein n=1 Tax=Aspergillus avenaceus TaxID=36643 RepID=A0A5N6U5S4_ASPAV|nr:hypothetical protein BDV25DRAFT_136365 [Aspergillus avenaceus]
MSHPLVAAVWEQLRRCDIANILREIIGEHAADVAIFQAEDGPDARIEHLMRSVFWIKAIFDLQRSYIQGLTSIDGHFRSLPYLLSSETIFSTLMYLVQVKPKLFPCGKAVNPGLVMYRHFLALTLLAGVRLLLLRGENIQFEMKFNLERAIRSAWQDHELPSAERYLVNTLLPKLIEASEPSQHGKNDSYFPVHRNNPLKLSTGPSPSFRNSDTLITDLLTALMTNNAEQLNSFVALYDMLWAAESTMVQSHMDNRRISQEQGPFQSETMNVDSDFDRAREARMKLARTVLAAFDDEFTTPSLQILATIVLSQNAEGHPPLQTRRIRDTWAQLSRIRELCEGFLNHLVRWLINRRVQLWDCNGELEAASHDYQQHLTQWLLHSPLQEDAHPGQKDEVYYAVDCPSVHAVPTALLEDHLSENDKSTYELRKGSQVLELDTFCPLCPENTKIRHVRRIEPVGHSQHHIGLELGVGRSYSFPNSLSRDTTSSSSLSHSTSHSSVRVDTVDGPRTPVSPAAYKPLLGGWNSKHSPTTAPEILGSFLARSKTDHSFDKQTTKSFPRELKNVTLPFSSGSSLFRRTSSKKNQLPREPRFGFSSSGNSLLLWGIGSNWVARFEMNSVGGQKPKGYRYDISGVQHVAAGDLRCAVIAAVGEHYELLIFKGYGSNPEICTSIEMHHPSSLPIYMVMSRDDRYVAFTLNNEIYLYEIMPNSIRKVSLGDSGDASAQVSDMPPGVTRMGISLENDILQHERQSTVMERKLQFSVDGKYFVIATHLDDYSAYVDVWDLSLKRWNVVPGRSRSFRISQRASTNRDLTCVFYDTLHHAVLLPAFFEKECPIPTSLADKDAPGEPASTRIVHAAQSPSGSQFAIANGMNQIYLFDSTASGSLRVSRVKKASNKISSSVFRPGYLTLAFPRDEEMLVFWMDSGKLMLRSVRLHEGNSTSKDYDLRSEFDRMMLERPPGADSPMQLKRNSLLSNQQSVEMDGFITITSRPKFSELPSPGFA